MLTELTPVVINPNGTPQRVSLSKAISILLDPKGDSDTNQSRRLRNRNPEPRKEVDTYGIAEEYEAGTRISEIAEMFGVSESVVIRHARKAGSAMRSEGHRRPMISPEKIADVQEARRNGDTIREIAVRFGMTYGHVRDLVAETGVKRAPTRLDRVRPEIEARLKGGERPGTIARDLELPEKTVALIRHEVMGRIAPPLWTAEEDDAIRVATTRKDAVLRYRRAFPESKRSIGAIYERLRVLRFKDEIAHALGAVEVAA